MPVNRLDDSSHTSYASLDIVPLDVFLNDVIDLMVRLEVDLHLNFFVNKIFVLP